MPIAVVAQYVEAGNFSGTGTPKTVSVTVATNDVIVVIVVSSDYRQIPSTPTGGGLTYNQQFAINNNVSNLLNNVNVWTAIAGSSQTFTMSISISPNNAFGWGYLVLRLSGVNTIGNKNSNSNTANTAPSVSLTTTVNDSAIIMVVSNFNQIPNTRTYRTAGVGSFTETEFVSNSSIGGVTAGVYLDVITAGIQTIGMTAGATTWAWICAGIELTPTVTPPVVKQLIVVSRAALVNAFTT